MKRLIALIFGAGALTVGANTPLKIDIAPDIKENVRCNHIYEVDPSYVPDGLVEEAAAAQREATVVYSQKGKGTNLFVDCINAKGDIYSVELSRAQYQKYSQSIHGRDLPGKTVELTAVEMLVD